MQKSDLRYHNRFSPEIAGVYISIGVGMLFFFALWYFPLFKLGALGTPTQDPNFSDANFYLYHSLANCNGSNSNQVFDATWSSVGVIRYLTFACSIIPIDLSFLIFNIFLYAISFSYYLRSFGNSYYSYGIMIGPALCIYTLCLLFAPGKEILSFAATCFAAGSVQKIESARSRMETAKSFSICALAVAIASFSRIHEGVLLASCVASYFILRRFGIWTMLPMAVLFLTFVNFVFEDFIGKSFVDALANDEAPRFGFDQALKNIVTSENPVVHFFLAPLRVLLVPLGSVAGLFASPLDADIFYFLYRDILQRMRFLDMSILFCGFYAYFRWHWPQIKFPPFLIVFSLFVITWGGIFEKSRYFFVYVPLLLPYIFCRRVN